MRTLFHTRLAIHSFHLDVEVPSDDGRWIYNGPVLLTEPLSVQDILSATPHNRSMTHQDFNTTHLHCSPGIQKCLNLAVPLSAHPGIQEACTSSVWFRFSFWMLSPITTIIHMRLPSHNSSSMTHQSSTLLLLSRTSFSLGYDRLVIWISCYWLSSDCCTVSSSVWVRPSSFSTWDPSIVW